MASSYSRRCRSCNRWINMRQMPHGQWVPFENNEPHKCEAVPAPPPPRPAPPRPAPIDPPDFPDIEIPEDVAEPVWPSPQPRPRPEEPPVSPAPRSRPSPPVNPQPPPQPQPQPAGGALPQRPTARPPAPEVIARLRLRFTDLLRIGAYGVLTIYLSIGVLHSIA